MNFETNPLPKGTQDVLVYFNSTQSPFKKWTVKDLQETDVWGHTREEQMIVDESDKTAFFHDYSQETQSLVREIMYMHGLKVHVVLRMTTGKIAVMFKYE